MKNDTLLPLALTYLSRGWSVIVCGPDKRPLVSWKEFQQRKPTLDEVIKWFEQFPDAQVGVVTGEISDLLVVDVEANGDLDLIQDKTFTVKTGGGGKHYLFRYDADFTNAVRLLPNIDIRSQGGYIVAPGSTTTKGVYSVIVDAPVAVMSEKTKALLLGARAEQKKERGLAYRMHEQNLARGAEALDYPGYGPGQRNDEMTRYIGAVLARIHPSLWETTAWGMVQFANRKNQPPLSDRELLTTFGSIKARESRQNPGGRRWNRFSNLNAATTSLAPQNGGPSGLPGNEKAHIVHVSEAAEKQVIDTDHTFAMGMRPFDEALLGGFSVGDLVVVAGKTGSGKTSIILDWSTTLAMGGNGAYANLPSLWFSYEVLAKPLWTKFKNIGAQEDTPVYVPSFNESVNSEWVVEMIKQGIDEKGIKVVVVDHLGFLRAPRGDYANQADAIQHTVRMLKQIAVSCGLIIFLPVHVRKTNSKTMDTDDIKDASGIANESDTVFFIDRMKNDRGMMTEQAKLWLSKNRKTGTMVSGIFDFKFGRYFYNEKSTVDQGLVDIAAEAAKKQAEEEWAMLDRVKSKKEAEKKESDKDEDIEAPALW